MLLCWSKVPDFTEKSSNLPCSSSNVMMTISEAGYLSIFLISHPPDLFSLSKNSSNISSLMLLLMPDTLTIGSTMNGEIFNSQPDAFSGDFCTTLCATVKKQTKKTTIYYRKDWCETELFQGGLISLDFLFFPEGTRRWCLDIDENYGSIDCTSHTGTLNQLSTEIINILRRTHLQYLHTK